MPTETMFAPSVEQSFLKTGQIALIVEEGKNTDGMEKAPDDVYVNFMKD